MPEYFSYIAIVVAILLIATILVICYPNLRYRSIGTARVAGT